VGYADYFLIQAAVSGTARQLLPLARDAARRALDLDPALPEANAMLGIVAGGYEHDWREAERRFRLALARDPVPPLVLTWHAFFSLLPAGHLSEAEEEFRRALQQDPLNVQFRYFLGFSLAAAGRPEEAEAEFRQVLEIDQNFFLAYVMLSISIGGRGRFAAALEYAEKAYALAPWFAGCAGTLAGILKRTGNAGRAEEVLQKSQKGDENRPSLVLFWFHLACGEPDQAAGWLDQDIEQRNPVAGVFVRFAQALYPSPSWAAVAKKMNLPE
jgi:tetratricopeptide (TPR) repeat protein